ncbi:MAG: hypothetical protein IPK24_10700 [Kineosporiaceae bacterium]|nr:hypothetical protein [Kineosporiaceae bacterium]
MPFVLTIDQRGSSTTTDLVDHMLARLTRIHTRLPFERTAGDEFQGLLEDPVSVVDAILDLVRDGNWHIGLGAGPVAEPLPSSTRAARGSAFERARAAVEAAKRRPQHLAVQGADTAPAAQADAVLTLLAAVIQRRSEAAWQAIDLDDAGLTAAQAATKLGISRQAVGQRLAVGLRSQELAVRPVIADLLIRAERLPPAAEPTTPVR